MSNIEKDIHLLEHMISQMIVEQQVKLGYVKETVRLYLPSSTLEGILQTSELKEPFVKEVIENFSNCFTSQSRSFGIPVVAQWIKNPTSIYEDAGLIPDLAQCVKNPALLQAKA